MSKHLSGNIKVFFSFFFSSQIVNLNLSLSLSFFPKMLFPLCVIYILLDVHIRHGFKTNLIISNRDSYNVCCC